VLGCDGSYPGPGGAASGYLVQERATTLWLDAGPGTFANLQQVCDPGTVDAVVLSHEHPDHWTDLESFAVWRRRFPVRPPVPVYAPPGLRRRSYFADDRGLAWEEVGPSYRLVLGDLTCSFVATDHGPPTLAVRVDPTGGPAAATPVVPGSSGISETTDLSGSLAYSADTGPDWSVEELGRGIGTVLCEATYTRAHEGELRHLSGRQAGAMAAAAGVGRLVLTHRWPTVSAGALAAEADEAFGRPVHQAVAGRVFEW
jgi:ribonuclease BN (tRNA processing enzyme)